jgi:S1-C subfamily serine protease
MADGKIKAGRICEFTPGVKAHELKETSVSLHASIFMSVLRLFYGLCAAVFFAVGVCAQDMEEILESVSKVYAHAEAYQADVDTRTIRFDFAPDAAEGAAPYAVVSTFYRRIQLKVRRPNSYSLTIQTFRDNMAGGMGDTSSGNSPINMMGRNSSSWSMLVRTENMQSKQGSFMGGRFTVRDVSAQQFESMANAGLGSRVAEDVVLRYFQARETAPTGGLALGLRDFQLVGRDTIDGRSAHRVVAKTSAGHSIMLWIDQDAYVVVRTIVQRSFRVSGGTGRRVSVVESLYKNQQLAPAFSGEDFVIKEPLLLPPEATAEEMGFAGVAELVQLAKVAPSEGGENESSSDNPFDTPTAPEPVILKEQALSYEQMSGIVLIEGDKGTATGFMTKIRDVDFVVTNLHVLGGNKKFTLKTLGGEEIEPLGIFGAMGSDIAIIRIKAVQGELKLAEDVFKNTKIGDKVVVVGNRLGGGVATQTAGSVVGVGPTRIEVSANFESGNSGSPIINLETKEVVGVATYSETREVSVDDRRPSYVRRAGRASEEVKVEKRWFGYRLDSPIKWQAIDLARWNAESQRIEKFRKTSEALVAVIRLNFSTARQHPRLTSVIDGFEARYQAAGNNSITAASEVKDLFRVVRTVSEDGVRDLTQGDFYDYYRTCLYWENSIPAQLEYRRQITEALKKYEANSSLYLSRMRNGN